MWSWFHTLSVIQHPEAKFLSDLEQLGQNHINQEYGFPFGVTDVEKVGEPPAYLSQSERFEGKQVYIRPSNQYRFSGVTFSLESECPPHPPNHAQP